MDQTAIKLTDLEVPKLSDEQLDKFTEASIYLRPLQKFDALLAVERLRALDGHRVIAADFGGDKGVVRLFKITEGELSSIPDYEDYVQGDGGAGYLECLERIAQFVGTQDIPVGISWGGPLDGTRPGHHDKFNIFIQELNEKYDGDLRNVLPTLSSCINDGPAGLIAGAITVNQGRRVENVILAINGGGLGAAVLSDNTIYATEAGHVEGVETLNIYNQSKPCGVFDAKYTCIEQLGANKAGIEVQWQQATGEYMRARDIEDRYKEGNAFAGELYEHSALVVAHMIQGTANAMKIDILSPRTAIVGHGGAFRFPGYGDRVQQILTKYGVEPHVVLTHTFVPRDSNACLDGAALSALLNAAESPE